MSNEVYKLYKSIKQDIERYEADENNRNPTPLVESWKEFIVMMDRSNTLLAGQYEREKALIATFTPEQIDHICYQIGEWYLSMKPLLEGQHNLGYMKERLKIMICGE